MSRSLRYRVVPGQTQGRFAVYDTSGAAVVHDGFRTREQANARARGLNETVTPKSGGYQSVRCPGCSTALLVRPGDAINCPQCAREREAVEAQIEWMETREAELQAARFTLEDVEAREFAVSGDRWDGLS